MNADEFLRSTPPEINWRIQAWNDLRRYEARRDYDFAILLLNGRNDPKKFPKFEKFYPEKPQESDAEREDREMRKHGRAVGMRVP